MCVVQPHTTRTFDQLCLDGSCQSDGMMFVSRGWDQVWGVCLYFCIAEADDSDVESWEETSRWSRRPCCQSSQSLHYKSGSSVVGQRAFALVPRCATGLFDPSEIEIGNTKPNKPTTG